MKKYLLPILIVVALLAITMFPESMAACPNCKEAYMETDGASVASGYNTSIILMMAVPFVVLGTFAVRLWVTMRKNKLTEQV